MLNILRFLKDSKKYVAMIILLLIVQAYCDLALPGLTSNILNVGLQQGGIEDAVPATIRQESMDDLCLFMSEEEGKLLNASYLSADEKGIRTFDKTADRETLQSALLIPEVVIYQIESGRFGDQMTLEGVKYALASGMMTKEDLLTGISQGMTMMSDLSESYLNQIAVYYVSGEYEAQGLDLNKIRNRYLLGIGGRMLLMAFFMSLAAVLTGLIASIVSAGVGRGLRLRLYKKVMSFTGAEMERFSTASLITRATNDVQQIQFVSVMLLRMVAYAPILAIAGIIKVTQYGSGMSWIIILAVVLLSACVGILVAVAMPKFQKMQSLVDRLNLVSREMLTGIMPIRAFSREKHEEKRFEGANHDLFSTQLFTNRTMTFMAPIMMFIMNGISVLIVWVGAHHMEDGTMQVGDLTAFITYSMVIVMGFLMLAMVSIMLPRAGVAADRIMEVLNTEVTLKESESPKDHLLKAEKGGAEIIFDHVGFAYPGAGEKALSDISFTAEAGKTTAIIGSTGCGKTSLLKLIPRFFDVTEGKITLDGVDIRDLSLKTLRDNLGYVPQKSVLFSGTVDSNIRYGKEEISDEEMRKAAEIAQASSFILEHDQKFERNIAQGGSNVSGGQKQRLSIARAIAKNPRVFLFDDSFSALDYKTDLALRKALETELSEATVIIVAQRIATILHADKIIVLEDGRVAGIGKHEELLNSCKTYQEIAYSQLSEAELKGKGGEVHG